MRDIIHLATHARETLVDITERVRTVVKASGVRNGLVSVCAQGATAAVMIQENWDDIGPRPVMPTAPIPAAANSAPGAGGRPQDLSRREAPPRPPDR